MLPADVLGAQAIVLDSFLCGVGTRRSVLAEVVHDPCALVARDVIRVREAVLRLGLSRVH